MSAPFAVILRQASGDDFRNAILRVWAADVRDRRPPRQEASPAATVLAGVLCRVLDASRELLKSGRPHCGLDETREQLLDKLLSLGVQLPAAPFETKVCEPRLAARTVLSDLKIRIN